MSGILLSDPSLLGQVELIFFLNLNLIAVLIIKAAHLFPLSLGRSEDSVEICSCSRFQGAPPLLWRVV